VSTLLVSLYQGGGQYGFSGSSIVPTNIRSGILPAGTNDLWTIPAGYRCIVASIRTSTTNGIQSTNYSYLKTNGVYYRYSVNITIATNVATTVIGITGDNFLWEAGETVALNAGLAGESAIISALLFPTNVNAYSPRMLSVTTSTNTLYICPANKVALNMPFPNQFPGYTDFLVRYRNDTGVTRTVKMWNVASNSVPSLTNLYGTIVTADTGLATYNGTILFPGESLQLSSDSSAATQWAYTTVIEIPFP
jgi:hypothetical protein